VSVYVTLRLDEKTTAFLIISMVKEIVGGGAVCCSGYFAFHFPIRLHLLLYQPWTSPDLAASLIAITHIILSLHDAQK